jgi:exosortase family protein XrtF
LKASRSPSAFIKFLILASALYLLLFLVHQFIVKRYTYYDQRFITWIIQGADVGLRLLGYKTFMVLQDRDIQVLGIDGSNGVWVGSNCNAISLFSLFSVFVIAYPGPWKHKAWFIPAGILAIHLINILRVVALAIIANYDYRLLDFNHTYTFTFLVYGFIFALWIIWVNRFSKLSGVIHEAKS